MKKGITLMVLTALIGVGLITAWAFDGYQYDNSIGSYWNLSVKASSLDVKSQYLDQFISAVRAANLSGNDALIFKTPDNSYEQNFDAITSLQSRMHAFVGQDPTTMAYQQAISQITAQEEDDNSSTIQVINGLWWKSNHYFFWNPIYIIAMFILLLAGVAGGIVLCVSAD